MGFWAFRVSSSALYFSKYLVAWLCLSANQIAQGYSLGLWKNQSSYLKIYWVLERSSRFWISSWSLILEKVMRSLQRNSRMNYTGSCCPWNRHVSFLDSSLDLVFTSYSEPELWFAPYPWRGHPKPWWVHIWTPSFIWPASYSSVPARASLL